MKRGHGAFVFFCRRAAPRREGEKRADTGRAMKVCQSQQVQTMEAITTARYTNIMAGDIVR